MMENKTKIELKNKSIFITGVAGFIGSNLAKRLLSTVEGVKVVGLDNMNNYYDVRLKEARLKELEQFEKFSFVKGNLADKAVIESIFEQYKPEIVVNLGAQAGVRYSITNPDAYVEANLIGFYSDQGLCMLFDLEEAIMFTPKPQEYADPLTGEMKKKQMKFFPDTYRNRIGKSYNDYIADHQMNMFEDFIGYQGSAVLDEPVREEDSFSKESMSQESEISENILLPDLAKQSESIEQQSGEIAERGMPT